MLGNLSAIEEYNNAGALMGTEMMESEELNAALQKMPMVARTKTVQKLVGNPFPSKGSRAEMEKHFAELPKHIKEGLGKGDLRLADTVIYSIKPASSKTIKMFETQDDKQIGLRNVSNAKLPKGSSLLVSGIVLLAGVSADGTPDKVMATNYGQLEAIPSIANGEFSLKANKKQIVPDTSNSVFKTLGYGLVPIGYYKLSNPRLIHDDVLIEMTIELGTMDGIAANTYIFAGLHGTITTP